MCLNMAFLQTQVFLKASQYSQENTYAGDFFKKSPLLKRDSNTDAFL